METNLRHDNLFEKLNGAANAELIDVLAAGTGVRIERIVSMGQASPDGFWYDQNQSEWVVVLSGHGVLEFEDHGATLEMAVGDYCLIAAGRRHRVKWTSPDEPTVWLAVFFESPDE